MSASLPRLGDSAVLPRASASRPRSSASGTAPAPAAAAVASLGVTDAASSGAQSALLRRLSMSLSLQELAYQQPHRARKEPTPWVAKYQDVAKREFVHADIAPLLHRFASTSTYYKPQRKPLSVALQEIAAPAQVRDDVVAADAGAVTSRESQSSASRDPVLPSQTTLIRQRRDTTGPSRTHSSAYSSGDRATGGATAAIDTASIAGCSSPTAAQSSRIVPTRFLFDRSRWLPSARCDYCSNAGGDLACATCDVIAHAQCYLRAFAASPLKAKGAFVVPTRFSWLCSHCQQALQTEYDDRVHSTRMQHIAAQRHVFGQAVTAYVRMAKDAHVFATKKRAIVRIQAAVRGRLARLRFERLLRAVLKPYVIAHIRIHGLLVGNGSGTTNNNIDNHCNNASTDPTDDLRLANGLTCNPYVYVSVVDGRDDETQLFCFETAVRRGVALADARDAIGWRDALFVPGMDGNATLVFTLLSRNGPNHFFLGQAVLRLRDSDSIWRAGGAATDLKLADDVAIFPKTAQRQLLRLVEVGSSATHAQQHSTGSSSSTSAYNRDRRRSTISDNRDSSSSSSNDGGLFANSCADALSLSVHVQPCSDAYAYCGYLGLKPTLDSARTSARWCVLADGVLRIYRHFGVTLASDVVDMAHVIDVRLVEARRAVGIVRRSTRSEQLCIAIQHVSRLFVLQAEHRASSKLWLKKLQAATKCGSVVATTGAASGASNTSSSSGSSASAVRGADATGDGSGGHDVSSKY